VSSVTRGAAAPIFLPKPDPPHPPDLPKVTPPDLAIVLPVYNVQASLRKVVLEWFQEIENWTEIFLLLCLDNGSTDDTLKILHRLRDQFGSRLHPYPPSALRPLSSPHSL
jgi:hypothetical protein